jgi:hypothetical protein
MLETVLLYCYFSNAHISSIPCSPALAAFLSLSKAWVQISRVVEGVIDLPQPLGEGVWADGLPVRIVELDYSVFFDRMRTSDDKCETDTRICRYAL